MNNDKIIERERYDQRAKVVISKFPSIYKSLCGAESLSLPIRKPYIFYESLLVSELSQFSLVLELGAGTGSFTGVLLRTGSSVCATDIAPTALGILEDRYQGVGRLITKVADMECLPFEDESFDVVASAGSLSYGDNILVMNEIFRVLRPGGVFICVDSLNHNPIYRFNRWIHFLRGQRTRSTLIRMPTLALIEHYRARFGEADVHFFGACSWASPVFGLFLGKARAARILDWLDEFVHVRKSAFKFVLKARKAS
jgi:ubiquinone/menaquinone biosynthesis C-methylase UbiE